MGHLGTWFCGGLGSAGFVVRLDDLNVNYKFSNQNDSMILICCLHNLLPSPVWLKKIQFFCVMTLKTAMVGYTQGVLRGNLCHHK